MSPRILSGFLNLIDVVQNKIAMSEAKINWNTNSQKPYGNKLKKSIRMNAENSAARISTLAVI